jgi:cytochrome P450
MENPTIEGFTVDYHFIKQNFTTLVIAGIDTSSNVAGILLYMLAKHPEIKVNFL